MKACSYCGKDNELAATHCKECGTELSPGAIADVPAEPLSPPLINAEEIRAGFKFVEGFHRADWEIVRRWIETNLSAEDREQAWNEAATLWVSQLRSDLGGNYFILQSPQTILLCDLPSETARWLLDYSGKVAGTIKRHLPQIAWHGALGKDVVLIFSDHDDYYQYLSYHSPDGEQAASGGSCIHSGYTHIALPWQDAMDAANAVVHELTHDCLDHLPLPLWLNEGVTVTLQKLIAPLQRGFDQGEQQAIFDAAINWQPPVMWDELAERHFAFWTEKNIQSFWAGTSFYEPGEANALSYSLAEVFVKLLNERSNGAIFQTILKAARSEDAGQTAVADILSADLGEIAATFLGEGNWRPQRKAIAEHWEKVGWNEIKASAARNI